MSLAFDYSLKSDRQKTGGIATLDDSVDVGRITLQEEEFEAEIILSDPIQVRSNNGGGFSKGEQNTLGQEFIEEQTSMAEQIIAEENMPTRSVIGFKSEPILTTDNITPVQNWTPPPTNTPTAAGLPTTKVVSCELPTGVELQPGTQPQTWSEPEKHYYDPFAPIPTRVPANFPSVPKEFDVPIPVEPPAQSKNTPFVAAPNSPIVKGSLFFDPEEGCDACCHAPIDGPSQFYTMCLLASTDPAITQMVENGMIEQVYSSIPALQEKFENGLPGAFLRETRFTELTNNQIATLADSNLFETPASMISSANGSGMAGIINRSSIQSYQFQKKLKFKLPKNCQHLTLFAFIRLDEIAFREFYKMPVSAVPPGVYVGAIKEVSVIVNSNLQTSSSAYLDAQTMRQVRTPIQKTSNGQIYSFEPGRRTKARRLVKVAMPVGNIRSSQVLNNLVGVCSTSINEAIQFGGSQNG